MHSESPIGIYDSGVGGLSVLRAIRDALPHESLLYVADSAHVPYGEKTQEYVERRAAALADYFVSRQAKAMVVACNTATAAAIAPLRQRHPKLVIIGVEPAIKPAAHLTHSGVVGVFATTGTLASPKFAALVRREAPEVRILFKPCPEWVRLVERGVLDGVRTLLRLAGGAAATEVVAPQTDGGDGETRATEAADVHGAQASRGCGRRARGCRPAR